MVDVDSRYKKKNPDEIVSNFYIVVVLVMFMSQKAEKHSDCVTLILMCLCEKTCGGDTFISSILLAIDNRP